MNAICNIFFIIYFLFSSILIVLMLGDAKRREIKVFSKDGFLPMMVVMVVLSLCFVVFIVTQYSCKASMENIENIGCII